MKSCHQFILNWIWKYIHMRIYWYYKNNNTHAHNNHKTKHFCSFFAECVHMLAGRLAHTNKLFRQYFWLNPTVTQCNNNKKRRKITEKKSQPATTIIKRRVQLKINRGNRKCVYIHLHMHTEIAAVASTSVWATGQKPDDKKKSALCTIWHRKTQCMSI